MKITTKKSGFRPFDFTISVDTEAEYAWWLALMNHKNNDMAAFIKSGNKFVSRKLEKPGGVDHYQIFTAIDRD